MRHTLLLTILILSLVSCQAKRHSDSAQGNPQIIRADLKPRRYDPEKDTRIKELEKVVIEMRSIVEKFRLAFNPMENTNYSALDFTLESLEKLQGEPIDSLEEHFSETLKIEQLSDECKKVEYIFSVSPEADEIQSFIKTCDTNDQFVQFMRAAWDPKKVMAVNFDFTPFKTLFNKIPQKFENQPNANCNLVTEEGSTGIGRLVCENITLNLGDLGSIEIHKLEQFVDGIKKIVADVTVNSKEIKRYKITLNANGSVEKEEVANE